MYNQLIAMALQPNQTLGPYVILAPLGAGGMGEVYRAHDPRLGREVAIKVLPADMMSNPTRKQRFVQEARAASALNHPNIVTIYDISKEGDIDFLVMEYVKGKTLERLIPNHGMRLAEALRCGIQITQALAKAHANGIIHRDLKPSNLIVSEDGVVKILDFGLAKMTGPVQPGADDSTIEAGRPGLSQDGQITGTPAYMSPEQAEGKPVDARTDIFSFGSVFYEMITGRVPFHGDSVASKLAALIKDEPKPPQQLVEDLPKEVERVILRCLRKDPARRFLHMDDLRVVLEDLKQESESGQLTSPAPGQPKSRRRVWVWVAAVAVAGISLAWVWLTWPLKKTMENPLAAVPLTSYPGSEGSPAFSPDGSQVAFTWSGENRLNRDIYVKLADAGLPLRLTTDPANDSGPAWSPDGRFIAFVRQTGQGKGAVMLIPALGGTERKLAELVEPDSIPGRPLCWTPGSKHLIVVDRRASGVPTGLFVVSVETGEKRPLIPPSPTSMGDRDPALSPDGRAVAFARSTSFTISDIYWLELSADLQPVRDPKQLTFDNRTSSHPTWTPDGREIIYASNRLGSSALWRITPGGGGEPRRLAGIGDGSDSPAISRAAPGRGPRLAFTSSRSDRNIWRVGISGANAKESPAALIASTRNEHSPQYSPDGKRIAFASDRTGSYEIWVADSNGSNATPLTSFGGPITDLPRWSPDGRRIAFHSRLGGQAEVYTIPADGGKPQRLTDNPTDDVAPSWSRDGKWIYFGSNRTGEHQIWKMPADGGSPVQVTKAGGLFALESPDGRFLYYTKSRGKTELWKAAADGGGEIQIAPSIFYLNFTVEARGVYFLPEVGADAGASIQVLGFDGGAVSRIATIEKQPHTHISVSLDNGWILFAQSAPLESDLMLVENFH